MSRTRVEWIIASGLLSVIMALAFSSPAQADERWLGVQWTTAPGCVDTAALPEASETLLGERPSAMAVQVGAFREPDSQWRVDVRVQSETGETVQRTLRSADCSTLTMAVALVIAVQADPVATASTLESVVERESESETEALVVPETDAVVEPELQPESVPDPGPEPEPVLEPRAADRTPRSRDPPRIGFGVAVAGDLGVLPGAAANLELSVGPVWRRFRLDAAGLATVAPSFDFAAGAGASFSGIAGAVRACGVLGASRLEVLPCGGMELGALIARGRGTATESVTATWAAAFAGVRPQLVLRDRYGVGVMAEVVVPVLRHEYSVGDEALFVTGRLAARLGATFRVRLP